MSSPGQKSVVGLAVGSMIGQALGIVLPLFGWGLLYASFGTGSLETLVWRGGLGAMVLGALAVFAWLAGCAASIAGLATSSSGDRGRSLVWLSIPLALVPPVSWLAEWISLYDRIAYAWSHPGVSPF